MKVHHIVLLTLFTAIAVITAVYFYLPYEMERDLEKAQANGYNTTVTVPSSSATTASDESAASNSGISNGESSSSGNMRRMESQTAEFETREIAIPKIRKSTPYFVASAATSYPNKGKYVYQGKNYDYIYENFDQICREGNRLIISKDGESAPFGISMVTESGKVISAAGEIINQSGDVTFTLSDGDCVDRWGYVTLGQYSDNARYGNTPK
ncbi:MAG: hypothetical protein V4616_06900 [Bacteroidota bacterium]